MDKTVLRRMMFGCLGALTPIIVNLLIVDLQTALRNVTVIVAISYTIRLVALCASACIVVLLNSDEDRPAKLIQLGIVAPALLTGIINGTAIANQPQPASQSTPSSPSPQGNPPPPTHSAIPITKSDFAFEFPAFIATAHAQAAATSPKVLDCTKPASPTVSQQILQGLVGISPDNQWFVVVGSNPTAQSAADDVGKFDAQFAGKYSAEICAPTSATDARYRVVIGEYLSYAAATSMKTAAIAAGFPASTWVWNPILNPQQQSGP